MQSSVKEEETSFVTDICSKEIKDDIHIQNNDSNIKRHTTRKSKRAFTCDVCGITFSGKGLGSECLQSSIDGTTSDPFLRTLLESERRLFITTQDRMSRFPPRPSSENMLKKEINMEN
ncbi:hypothetical protein HNY73_018820 [Argiope bruennichi]|uniref:Uncharacterized protein n=1 Tax=Argiope bruennichi TaxID=94029 RepID=A0A8T0EI96_ARGBR|nr:hypothetical protein HNY73_018820 [Argiope bruennichi]